MKKLKNDIEKIITSLADFGEVTAESLKEAIEESEVFLNFVDSDEEATQYFKESELDGPVFKRENQKFRTADFVITIYEHYVDPGSDDYVYQVFVHDRF